MLPGGFREADSEAKLPLQGVLKGGISALQAIAPTSIFRSKTIPAESVEGGTYALRGIACKAENRLGGGCQKGIPPLVLRRIRDRCHPS